MQHRLKIRRDGADAWLLSDASTGTEVGGVQYEHSRDGNHYRAWLLVDGARRTFDDPLPQLAMAARAVEVARELPWRHEATVVIASGAPVRIASKPPLQPASQ